MLGLGEGLRSPTAFYNIYLTLGSFRKIDRNTAFSRWKLVNFQKFSEILKYRSNYTDKDLSFHLRNDEKCLFTKMYFPHKSGIFVNTRKLKHRAKTNLFLLGIYLRQLVTHKLQINDFGKFMNFYLKYSVLTEFWATQVWDVYDQFSIAYMRYFIKTRM